MCQETTDEVGVGRRGIGALVVDQAGCTGAAREFSGVDQVAVVAERDSGTGSGGTEDGLRVLPRRGTGRRITAMSDGDMSWHRCEGLLVEYLADQAEILEHQHLGAVGYRNAGSFLTTVLKCVQAVISELRHILSRRPDAEYTAFFAGLVLVLVGRVRSEEIWTVDRQIGTSHRALLCGQGLGASTVYGHFGTQFP
ncbi:hypothetical protein GCM10020255_105440 [Rhodococcus baikonurensis]